MTVSMCLKVEILKFAHNINNNIVLHCRTLHRHDGWRRCHSVTEIELAR